MEHNKGLFEVEILPLTENDCMKINAPSERYEENLIIASQSYIEPLLIIRRD